MLDAAMWRWGFAMLRNCTAARYEINKARMVRAGRIQPRLPAASCAPTRASPTTSACRARCSCSAPRSSSTAARKDIAILREYGVPYEVLDRAGCMRYEPALARVRDKFVGGLRLPGDETGDCFKFTQRLAAMAEALGAKFRFGTTIARHRARRRARRPASTPTRGRRCSADACRASRSAATRRCWLAAAGHRIPVYPVKGYSITVPIIDAGGAPESTIMDETHKVAVTRLGDRIRVGGMAELSGYT